MIVGPVDGILPPATNGQNIPYLLEAEILYWKNMQDYVLPLPKLLGIEVIVLVDEKN